MDESWAGMMDMQLMHLMSGIDMNGPCYVVAMNINPSMCQLSPSMSLLIVLPICTECMWGYSMQWPLIRPAGGIPVIRIVRWQYNLCCGHHSFNYVIINV